MAEKYFNTEGLCVSNIHYMVDTSTKIDKIIRDYVERGRYFVINRARQYGKTTTLDLLTTTLQDRYLVIQLSFEGSEGYFESKENLVNGVCDQIATALYDSHPALANIILERSPKSDTMDDLSARITTLCQHAENPVILIIDEVDRASDYTVFASFLGMLRKKYLSRRTPDNRSTFHNVILAGVHDIKNLKAKIRPDSEHAYNSPWNIAAPFDVDMSFAPDEIATMLTEYEADYNTGMDIGVISERLYYHTSGYPFLVSLLCRYIHEDKLSWTCDSVDAVIRRVLNEKNTLFDDMIKNLQNHGDFKKLVERIVLEGKTVNYNPDDPSIDLGVMYGIFARNEDQVQISNRIFSARLMNYFISTSKTSKLVKDRSDRDASLYIHDGVLDFDKVIERFSVFMHEEYRDKNSAFIEREARLLLLGYIKPIINGYGQYILEPQIRGGRAIDIIVQYKQAEYIIEVKIWRGEAYEHKAYDQIAGYAKARHQRIGYVVSFCDLQKAPRQGSVFTHNGIEIHETIIAYKDVF